MSTSSHSHRTFLPAAGHDWALPFYDPLVWLIGGDRAREALIEQAALAPGLRALDIGCGTGSFAVQVKRAHPGVEVVGLDPDPNALARAARKADGLGVSFDQGFADSLPYPDASFDRVFSSFMFHHLPAEQKEPTLREARRVLRAGGSFHMLDFGGPEHGVHGFFARLLHEQELMKDNAEDHVVELMKRAGFTGAEVAGERRMLFGRVAYYSGAVSRSRG